MLRQPRHRPARGGDHGHQPTGGDHGHVLTADGGPGHRIGRVVTTYSHDQPPTGRTRPRPRAKAHGRRPTNAGDHGRRQQSRHRSRAQSPGGGGGTPQADERRPRSQAQTSTAITQVTSSGVTAVTAQAGEQRRSRLSADRRDHDRGRPTRTARGRTWSSDVPLLTAATS